MISNTEQKPKIYRVRELTSLIKTVLEEEIGDVWVEGELSNVKQPSSGHYYFTLKDEDSQIQAVMFRGYQPKLRFAPEDGLVVRVFGLLSVYEKSGRYQILVREMKLSGKGAMQAAFEALKRKLAQERLFDPARKKPIPMLPRHIGIVTSPTGAAIRDIINVLFRRFPNLHIVLYPVKVQGEGAASQIAEAIDGLNALAELDVLIIGRGGGSLEDLWCFNEEQVARAIARSRIPVVSAVGHEIDFTIADFVADLRAPTPSAAAELVIGKKTDFEAELGAYSRRVAQAIQQYMLNAKNRLISARGSYVFQEPGTLVRQVNERMDRISMQMHHAIQTFLHEDEQQVDELNMKIIQQIKECESATNMKIHQLNAQLKELNPLAVLERGYSISSFRDGRIIKSVKQLNYGDQVLTRVANGRFESEVKAKSDSNI
jgi:exodeoxyribonuclease VII large subunit